MESVASDEPSLQSQLGLARALLSPPKKHDPAWPALAAAGFFSACALTFAFVAVLTPAREAAPIPAHHVP